MPAAFPHHYTCDLEIKDDASSWLKAAPRQAILGGNPPEFDGSDSWWSPEHLLLAALQTCYRGTWNATEAATRPTATNAACRARKYQAR